MHAQWRLALTLGTFSALAGSGYAAEAPLVLNARDEAITWGPCPPIFATGCEIAVLHGDPAKPNADVLLKIASGQTLPPHTHTSAERMILLSGTLSVKYRNAPAATLSPGMYAYGPPGHAHRATCMGDQACTLFIAFEGPVDALPFQGSVE